MMLAGWNINVGDLPEYAPMPQWWTGPDVELFEIPESPFAYVVYNLDEISMASYAGDVVVFRDKEHPVRVFAPNYWSVWPQRNMIHCNRDASVLLVRIANAYDSIEKHALVDLVAKRFAPVFLPNAVDGYVFTQLGTHCFAMISRDGDAPPYDRSYLIESTMLHWFEYTEKDGFDDVPMPSRYNSTGINTTVWHFREMAWQGVWHRAYMIALETDTPNDAKAVTDRALDRINMTNIGEVQHWRVGHNLEYDDQRLRAMLEEERATLHRERGKDAI